MIGGNNLRYSKFFISKYRAVDCTEVPISNSLIPVIGVNESGKTSILKAILAFDKLKDKYNSGEHLDYLNSYLTFDHECAVKAEVFFESYDEIEIISRKLRLPIDHELIQELDSFYTSKTSVVIGRSLEKKNYFLEDVKSLPEEFNSKLAEIIYEMLPLILYFDDFSDRVPSEIKIPKSYLEKGNIRGKGTNAEWASLIEELFNRSTGREGALSNFLNKDNVKQRSGILYDVQDTLNQNIIDQWKELKARGRQFSHEEEGDLKVELKFKEEDDFYFEFNIIDKSANEKRRDFNVVERSKGFQWFFNFIIKLKFNAKYRDDSKNAIYLLDEPGSYLHSTAQEELLNELKDISKHNTVIYCTHSQHLLNPDVINISSIRIAVKKNGAIDLKDFNSYEKNKFQGALSPLFDALHLRPITQSSNVSKIIITEGITDFYLFRMIQKYTELIDKKISIIPGSGAQNLKELISFAIAWSDNYLVLLDSDQEGKKAFRKYSKYFGEIESEKLYKYETPEKSSQINLEDYLHIEDQTKLLDLTLVDNLKSAIVALYYNDNETIKRRFVKKFNKDTLRNLEPVLTKIGGI